MPAEIASCCIIFVLNAKSKTFVFVSDNNLQEQRVQRILKDTKQCWKFKAKIYSPFFTASSQYPLFFFLFLSIFQKHTHSQTSTFIYIHFSFLPICFNVLFVFKSFLSLYNFVSTLSTFMFLSLSLFLLVYFSLFIHVCLS